MGKQFMEFMLEKKPISRWTVAKIFIVGIFCGTILTTLFLWLALI